MNTKTEGLLQQRLVDVIYGPGNERSEPVEELVEALISIAISSLAASSRRTPIESNTEPVAWIPQAHLDFLKMGVDGDGPSSAIVHDRPNEEMGWTIPLYLAAPVSVAPAVTDETDRRGGKSPEKTEMTLDEIEEAVTSEITRYFSSPLAVSEAPLQLDVERIAAAVRAALEFPQ